jgi:hypothetical protein
LVDHRLVVALFPIVATESPPLEEDAATPSAGLMHGKSGGQERDDNGLRMKLVWCLPGFVTLEQVERPGWGYSRSISIRL